jgi:hypothetical protein
VRLSPADAHILVSQLELDYATVPICLACLTFVSFPLDLGDARKARREAVSFVPDLWGEGLAGALRTALERAQEAGMERAEEAIGELGELGPRSEVVTEAILRLAAAQVEEMRAHR